MMFDLEHDRYSCSDLLLPDPGFTLDAAVGTTYSLDLEALLGVPVALGLLADADPELMHSPLYILEAIRKSADRIAIFCNAGSIQLPQNIQSVYALLEHSVFPVRLDSGSNFHPKLWVLKYSDPEGNSYVKLIVLSRNLTFDSSIDVCAALRGPVKRARRLKNKPLADMLLFLSDYADTDKQELVQALAEAILHVPRFEVEAPFQDYDFLPMGIPKHPGSRCPLLEKKIDLFAVSPFLSDGVVKAIANCSGRKTLITRKTSVTPAVMEAFDHVYVTREELSDNEYGANQDIHAKLYFVHSGSGNSLYLGSANASQNAFYKNVECLLRLDYKPYGMGFHMFSQEFFPEGRCPYEELTAVPELPVKDEAQDALDQTLREAVCAVQNARVQRDGDTYSIKLTSLPPDTAEDVRIAPLYRSACCEVLTAENNFSGLLLKELSEFYILSVQDRSVIIKVETTGIPQERDQAIYRSVIDTKAKFLSYLSFALADNYESAMAEEQLLASMAPKGPDSSTAPSASYAAIYEKLLKAYHNHPQRLLGIKDMTQRLDPDVVGPTFYQMFQQFETLTEGSVNRA